MARISVVLPAPFGPSNASSSPSPSANDAPSSALIWPNDFVAFDTVKTDMSSPGAGVAIDPCSDVTPGMDVVIDRSGEWRDRGGGWGSYRFKGFKGSRVQEAEPVR
jgi:hypothetical protein